LRLIASVLLAAASAYALTVLLAFVFQERLLFLPFGDVTVTPAQRGMSYEDVELRTADGVRLHGWFVPHPESRAILLFFHGNAGNISHRLDSLAIFHRLGLSTLIIDYRGYGRSEGRPTEAGTYRDAEAAWSYLVEERGTDSGEIVLFGRSLGAAVAAWLAARRSPRAVILESGFTSVPELGAELYPFLPVRTLARLEYDTRAQLREVHAPVLIVHSREDEIIPFHHALRLYEAAAAPKTLLELQGDHNRGFLISGERYVSGLDAFLSAHLKE
jgi:uncharacterized protein